MIGDNQNLAESPKTYRPWVGVVLSFFITGASQFLSGRRFVGLLWFVGLFALRFLGTLAFADPIFPNDNFGFGLFVVGFALWIAMLIQSYRPIPRFRWRSWFIFVFLFFFLACACYIGTKLFVWPFHIPTGGMSPTIMGNIRKPDGTMVSGDSVFVERYVYWSNEPQRGDIVVFRTEGIPEEYRELYHMPSNEFYIKRVAGVPGDILSIQNGHLYNNGIVVSQPNALANLTFPSLFKAGQISWVDPRTNYEVPDESYFLVGDNTTNSLDSRYYGAVPGKCIIGKVSKIYWPLDRAGRVQ